MATGDETPLTSLLTGDNAPYVDALYHRWVAEPSAVSEEWAALFRSWAPTGSPVYPGATALPGARPRFRPTSIFNPIGRGAPATRADVMEAALRQARVAQLINAYRVRGHTEADIDPLRQREIAPHPELELEYWGLKETDLDAPVSGLALYGVPVVTTLRQIVRRLRKAYCGSFGIEFMNIGDPTRKRWLQERVETLQDGDLLTPDLERHLLRLLSDAENFERLIHSRFPGTKRFSIEGAEALVPLLDLIIQETARLGVDEIILGMAHRGRLNVLSNVCHKPVRHIFDEFEDVQPGSFHGSGDVKYHLGYSSIYRTALGQDLLLSLAFNPSHLEAINPVVEGRVRARQDRRGGDAHAHVMALLVHGDAAFAGQGVVAETLNLSRLPGYATGGTIHVIVNNQIGFTTSPADARSTPYCTDVARMLAVPILHVNGEDPEALLAVARLAADWRQTFHEDVVIDMYCFRKHGHNEADEPSFTQPLLYQAIRSHPTTRVVYARRFVDERGDLSNEEVDAIVGESLERLEAALSFSRQQAPDSYTGLVRSEMGQLWAEYVGSLDDPVDTTFPRERLDSLLIRANTLPDDLDAHRKIRRLMANRQAMVTGEVPVDWALAEQAAFASLVDRGQRVRLGGQDSGRGTFSHRHAVITDVQTGRDYVPLANLHDRQAPFRVYDSLLSEVAVLGFEYGYSLEYPDALVIWEAQFGDFANGAQVVIDNFIMATEQKWNRNTGVVLLLPHGYEGQGPEHSSARLERYLTLCAEDNVVVANCTTPANFYHLLRRQGLQKVRKPLVVMSPKSLLRHPECVSTMDDLAKGGFARVIGEVDGDIDSAAVKRLVLCSGKVYYDLVDARRQRREGRVALVRVEQLHPFPRAEIEQACALFSPSVEIAWCQEEPRNMGAWPMVDEWLGAMIGGCAPRYIGRKRSAAPATGSGRQHRAELQAILDEVFTLDPVLAGAPDVNR